MKKIHFALLAAALSAGTAAADNVTPAVRAEADALARQYTGRTCRADYDLDTERYGRSLSATQIQAKRTETYNDWKKDLAEDAREDGGTYRIGFENNRVWAWQKVKKGQTEFKVVTISATGERELSCDL